MTVLFSDQDNDRRITQPYAVRITEVAALEYPADGYEYRGLIRSLDETGDLAAEQVLQTRRKPVWLVNMTHRGRGLLSIVLQSRPLGTQAWQDIGRGAFDPETYPNGQSSTLVELPLRGWDDRPQLRVQLRLSAGTGETRPDAGNQPPPQQDLSTPGRSMPGTGGIRQPVGETPSSDAELPTITPLTAPEVVIVKDVWNKFLAYQDMLMEMFFERLLHEEPDLLPGFGEAADLVPRYFAELFDASIRALNPQTERLLREGYQGIYPALPGDPKTISDYTGLLADLGMRPRHWVTARRIWVWTLSQIPHLEDYDRENLGKGVHSALYRFFTGAVLAPAVEAANQYEEALTSDMIRDMRRCGDIMAADPLTTGIDFYRILFRQHPEVLPYFGRTDVDALAVHLMRTIAFLVQSLEAGRDAAQELRDLSRLHAHAGVPPDAYAKIAGPMLTVMKQYIPDFTPALERAWGILLTRVSNVLKQPMVNQQRLLTQANEFMELIAGELAWEPADRDRRWNEIEREIHATGTYTHTYEELAYGAQLAWRNAGKCIGRVSWRTMIVRDLRHVTDPDEMFRECAEHLRMGTNGGNMQTVINVFRPKKPLERWGPRIWNSQ
ncbi:MAG: nitric oxide synthase oxygenase [Bacteroidetes bacterium]|nr:nitric oxide synthase oxygenase [Fibrella sp.]